MGDVLLTPEQRATVSPTQAPEVVSTPPEVVVTPQTVEATVQTFKAGYKTTEFWLVVLGHFAGWVGYFTTNNTVVQVTSLLAVFLPAIAYGSWRTYLKSFTI